MHAYAIFRHAPATSFAYAKNNFFIAFTTFGKECAVALTSLKSEVCNQPCLNIRHNDFNQPLCLSGIKKLGFTTTHRKIKFPLKLATRLKRKNFCRHTLTPVFIIFFLVAKDYENK